MHCNTMYIITFVRDVSSLCQLLWGKDQDGGESESKRDGRGFKSRPLLFVHCVSDKDLTLIPLKFSYIQVVCREIHVTFTEELSARRVALTPIMVNSSHKLTSRTKPSNVFPPDIIWHSKRSENYSCWCRLCMFDRWWFTLSSCETFLMWGIGFIHPFKTREWLQFLKITCHLI